MAFDFLALPSQGHEKSRGNVETSNIGREHQGVVQAEYVQANSEDDQHFVFLGSLAPLTNSTRDPLPCRPC